MYNNFRPDFNYTWTRHHTIDYDYHPSIMMYSAIGTPEKITPEPPLFPLPFKSPPSDAYLSKLKKYKKDLLNWRNGNYWTWAQYVKTITHPSGIENRENFHNRVVSWSKKWDPWWKSNIYHKYTNYQPPIYPRLPVVWRNKTNQVDDKFNTRRGILSTTTTAKLYQQTMDSYIEKIQIWIDNYDIKNTQMKQQSSSSGSSSGSSTSSGSTSGSSSTSSGSTSGSSSTSAGTIYMPQETAPKTNTGVKIAVISGISIVGLLAIAVPAVMLIKKKKKQKRKK